MTLTMDEVLDQVGPQFVPTLVQVNGTTFLSDDPKYMHGQKPDGFIDLETLKDYRAHDCDNGATVEHSGAVLHEMYLDDTPRFNHGMSNGAFWEKVNQIADILRVSEVWPFPPINIEGGGLYDGHHRSNAAIMVGWDKPIPYIGSATDEESY